MIVVSIYCNNGSVGAHFSPIRDNGGVFVIVVVIVMPLYSLPEAPLLHISIADGNILIGMCRTLLQHVGQLFL